MITITIKTDNAAFSGSDGGPELARILRNLAERVEYGTIEDVENDIDGLHLRDVNGNGVGQISTE